MYVVLYGSGGELDRERVKGRSEIAIKAAVDRLIHRCVLNPGDRILIEDDGEV